jgi:PTH1 family peptidyl-tRNA hydrolase
VWVVVGLGNPGARYRRTRHNVGFRIVDALGRRWRVEVAREAHQALVGESRRDGERVLLVKPQTFMNASGEAVASLQRYYRFSPERLVVVQDDVDLPLGRVRIRAGGGAGGHRGITSIIAALDDAGFARVKVGVGRPPAGWETADYLLAPPAAAEEAAALEAAEERGGDGVELVLAEGLARAMNRINQREAGHAEPAL